MGSLCQVSRWMKVRRLRFYKHESDLSLPGRRKVSVPSDSAEEFKGSVVCADIQAHARGAPG